MEKRRSGHSAPAVIGSFPAEEVSSSAAPAVHSDVPESDKRAKRAYSSPFRNEED